MRALSNVSFNEKKRIIELGDRTQSREFFNTVDGPQVHADVPRRERLQDAHRRGQDRVSIRQMFYMTKHTLPGTSENTFEDQSESDPIIEDLEVGIDALREELHLFANKRGLRRGHAGRERRRRPDRSRAHGPRRLGHSEHLRADELKFVRNDAEFILFVEKQAVWHRLNEDRFWEKHKCILMTSEGQAARGARRLLQRMHPSSRSPSTSSSITIRGGSTSTPS